MGFVTILIALCLTMDSVIASDFCAVAKFFAPTSYSIFKSIVCLILGCRIWISSKTYNQCKLITWSTLVILWSLFNIIAGNLTVTSALEEGDGQFTICTITPSFMYIISSLLLDLASGIVSCILFAVPIFKLYKISNNDIWLKQAAYKQAILSMIAIITNISATVGIGAFNPLAPVFVSINLIVSTISVILMFDWNSYITSKILCC